MNRGSLVMVAGLLALGCEAKLETTCVSGDCRDYEPVQAEQNLGACLETCPNLDQPSGVTGEYPCAVQKIMDEICTNCHTPGGSGPFPLDSYADSQVLQGPRIRYATITTVVGLEDTPVDFMPLGGPPLDTEQRAALMDDWACVCAPPRPDGETCE